MHEDERKERLTAHDVYDDILEQVQEFASKHTRTKFLSEDENMVALVGRFGRGNCTIEFNTTFLNISKPGSRGEYDNTFTFNFDDTNMNLSYYEFLPRRLQRAKIDLYDYNNPGSFVKAIKPYIDKLNFLIEYFEEDDEIIIPRV